MLEFDQFDDEVFGNDADDIACAVQNWETGEWFLQQLDQVLHGDDAFHTDWIVRHNLVCSDILAAFGAVVS